VHSSFILFTTPPGRDPTPGCSALAYPPSLRYIFGVKIPALFLATAVVLAGTINCSCSDDSKKESKEESLREKARGAADEVGDRASKLAESASERAEQVRARDLALRDKAAALEDKAGALKDRVTSASKDAVDIVRPYAAKTKDRVENLIADGKQQAKKAGKMVVAVAPAVADGIGFRPIYIEVDQEHEKSAIDKAIGKMPKVEVIDGLTVGFRGLTKRQFLVLWRQGAHLVGFVYPSLTDILIEHVVEQAPRLIRLIRD